LGNNRRGEDDYLFLVSDALVVNADKLGSEATLSITYEKPKGWLARILSALFADWYCKWCLKNMLNDSERILES
jgi:hypothetical protein